MLLYSQREGETPQKKGEQIINFYAAIIDKNNGHAVCGRYFKHAVDAWSYASPACGYNGAVIVYKGTVIVRKIERA